MENFLSIFSQEVKTSGSEVDEWGPYMSKVSKDLIKIFDSETMRINQQELCSTVQSILV